MERTVNSVKIYRKSRSPNAFFLFCTQNRRKLIDENPGVGNKDISKILGTLWSQLESHEKQEFYRSAEELHIKHMKEFSDYGFSPLTARRLREKVVTSHHKNNSLNQLIVWRPKVVQQISAMTDQSMECQTNTQTNESKVESISEEKRVFFRYLGLCQNNSVEYLNIKAKLEQNARKYRIFTFIQRVGHNGTNCTKKCAKEQNKVKRPRGRPRKYWPKSVVQTNRVNEV